jgi:hypothetical protein
MESDGSGGPPSTPKVPPQHPNYSTHYVDTFCTKKVPYDGSKLPDPEPPVPKPGTTSSLYSVATTNAARAHVFDKIKSAAWRGPSGLPMLGAKEKLPDWVVDPNDPFPRRPFTRGSNVASTIVSKPK